MRSGPLNLITDVQGLLVGNAQDENLKSGTTVLTADVPFVAAVDVMGGAPGTRETDLLSPDRMVESVDALVLSGGSAFGLDAASGVADALRSVGRGFTVGDVNVPLVPAAILFDLLNGGQKDWADNPYNALGKSAYKAASAQFELGSVGAGIGATTSTLKGGLGSASCVLDNGITVGALVAANPFGSVTTFDNRYFWGAPFELNNEFGGIGSDPRKSHATNTISTKAGLVSTRTNTTIAIVATDAVLTKSQAKRMAVAAQDGIARAIVPSHTPMDGDLVFAVSTDARPLENPSLDLMEIGHAGAVCLTRAIARGIYSATPASTDLVPTWQRLHAN